MRYLPFFQNFDGGETNIIYREANQFISYMAEIGVILIMYSAGLGTSLKSLIKSGFKATIIACCGVFVPQNGQKLTVFDILNSFISLKEKFLPDSNSARR